MERQQLEQGLFLIQKNVSAITDTECIPLHSALGRILAAPILSPIDVPPFDRSPYDGYGLFSSDIKTASVETPVHLPVVASFMAGDDNTPFSLKPGEAIRIMTGARIPIGVDCILPQEQTDYGETTVAIYSSLSTGKNICRQGEEGLQVNKDQR